MMKIVMGHIDTPLKQSTMAREAQQIEIIVTGFRINKKEAIIRTKSNNGGLWLSTFLYLIIKGIY